MERDDAADERAAEDAAAWRRWARRPRKPVPALPMDVPEAVIALALTRHGQRRLAQRSLSLRQVAYVLEHATLVHRTGAEFYVLRRRDVAPADRRIDTFAKVAGSVVLVAGASLVTAYRNPEALRHIRKKAKRRLAAA